MRTACLWDFYTKCFLLKHRLRVSRRPDDSLLQRVETGSCGRAGQLCGRLSPGAGLQAPNCLCVDAAGPPEGLGLTALRGGAGGLPTMGSKAEEHPGPAGCLSRGAWTPRGLGHQPGSGTEAGVMPRVSHAERLCAVRKARRQAALTPHLWLERDEPGPCAGLS